MPSLATSPILLPQRLFSRKGIRESWGLAFTSDATHSGVSESEFRRQRHADCNSVEDTQRPRGASEETSKRNQKVSRHPVVEIMAFSSHFSASL